MPGARFGSRSPTMTATRSTYTEMLPVRFNGALKGRARFHRGRAALRRAISTCISWIIRNKPSRLSPGGVRSYFAAISASACSSERRSFSAVSINPFILDPAPGKVSLLRRHREWAVKVKLDGSTLLGRWVGFVRLDATDHLCNAAPNCRSAGLPIFRQSPRAQFCGPHRAASNVQLAGEVCQSARKRGSDSLSMQIR